MGVLPMSTFNGHKRTKNRDRSQILYEICECIASKEHARRTYVMFRVNLSFDQLKAYMDELMRIGFVHESGGDQIARYPSRFYELTPLAREWMDAHARARELYERAVRNAKVAGEPIMR